MINRYPSAATVTSVSHGASPTTRPLGNSAALVRNNDPIGTSSDSARGPSQPRLAWHRARSMTRAGLVAAVMAVTGAIAAPAGAHADADSYGFLDFLSRNGEDVSSAEVQFAAIDYGYAICNLYRVSQSNDHVLRTMMRGTQNAALYSVGSVHYLCPEWEFLLPH